MNLPLLVFHSLSFPSNSLILNHTYTEFLYRYYRPLLLCSVTWLVSNAAFVGLLILLEPVAKYIGFNAQLNGETAADECFGLSLTYLAVCLVTLIPGNVCSTPPLNTLSQHTHSTLLLNTPYQHTHSTHPINTPTQHTLSTHPLNTPTQHTLNTPYRQINSLDNTP